MMDYKWGLVSKIVKLSSTKRGSMVCDSYPQNSDYKWLLKLEEFLYKYLYKTSEHFSFLWKEHWQS